MRRGVPVAVVAALACGQAAPSPAPLPTPDVRPIVAPRALRILPYLRVPRPPEPVVVCGGGDVMLGSNLDTTWAKGAQRLLALPTLLPSPDSLLAPLRPLVADADVVLVNVEGAIGTGPAPRKCPRRSTTCYAFRQNPAVAPALRRLAQHAQVVGNVANNHAMDAGEVGFDETVRYLRSAGVHVIGADSAPTLVPLPDGDTLALLGFSTFQAGSDARDTARVRRLVARAAARYRRVVVSLHAGAEGIRAQRTPDAVEHYLGENRGNSVAFARTAIAAGADLVVGHGPHVLRGAEWQGGGLAIYSLGNLLTYGPFSRNPPLDRGAIVCTWLATDGHVVQADIRPTRQVRPGLVYPDDTFRAGSLVDSLSRLDFPTTGVRVVWGMLRRPPVP